MAKNDAQTQEPKDTNTLLADALLKLADKLEVYDGANASAGITAEQLSTILTENAKSTRKALRPENERHPDISALNPEGERDHPRPKLTRKCFFAGIELKADDLSRTEIELLNAFTHNCTAKNSQWKAEIRQKGSDGELHLMLPVASTDDRMDLPNGFTLILRELLGGTKAVDAESLAQRVADLEQQLAAK